MNFFFHDYIIQYVVISCTCYCRGLGGGFHHCSGSSGGGFCAYADITLAIKVHNYVVTELGVHDNIY